MALSEELLEQIGSYLSGRMAADEKEQFDARLRQDADLRQEVALQQELKQGLSFLAQKDRFRQLHADLNTRGLLPNVGPQRSQPTLTPAPVAEPDARRVPVKRLWGYGLANWAMAASVVLLLGIGWVVYQSQTEKRQNMAQNERLFTESFSATLRPLPVVPADPDRLAASPDNIPSVTGRDSVQLRGAVAALQRADVSSAIRQLRALATGEPGHWRASAQWYLALAYLRNNQRADARPLLRTMARLNGHPYQADAQQLLNRLAAAAPSDRR